MSSSGLIETFGSQTFRESAHMFDNVVGRFTERMDFIRSDRTTSGLIETFGSQTFRESAHRGNNVVGRFTERMDFIRSDRATRSAGGAA